jgi:hypothetical protein
VRAHLARPVLAAALGAAAAAALSCGGGIKTVSRDGYTAVISFSAAERFPVAVRGEWKRVEATVGDSTVVKVMRPDLGKVWQYRPSTKRLYEYKFEPTDELVPGYPLEPGFDPQAYAHRFGGEIRQIDDAALGLHPCDRWEMTLPSGDVVTIWAARDLERLVTDIRPGASAKLFEKPKGYAEVKSVEEL